MDAKIGQGRGKKSQSQLREASMGVARLKALRDTKGLIYDFEFVFVSEKCETLTNGLLVEGIHYSNLSENYTQYPTFQYFTQVVANQQACSFSWNHLLFFDKYLEVMATPANEEIWITLIENKKRKEVEYSDFFGAFFQKDKDIQSLVDRISVLENYIDLLEEAHKISKVGTWEWDIASNEAKWSDELYRIVGREKLSQTVRVDDFFEFIHPEDRARVREATEKAAREKRAIPIKYRILTPKGEIKYVFGTGGYEIKNEAGEIVKLFGIIQDITELKQTEIALKESLEKEKELSEMKSRFVAIASHEFRTPLATILTSIGLVERYEEISAKEKRKKHINRIKSNVSNMRNMLDDFLSLSKLEEGKILARPECFSLVQFCKSHLEEMSNQTKKGQKIHYRHYGKEDVVNLDQKMLWNICNNLISNAIKYSEEEKDIWVHSHIDRGGVKIEVIDQGIGIPEEEHNQMFTRFFRAKNANSIKGTGLGMTIVKRYIDLMGGEISFQSQLGKGSTFTLIFPA